MGSGTSALRKHLRDEFKCVPAWPPVRGPPLDVFHVVFMRGDIITPIPDMTLDKLVGKPVQSEFFRVQTINEEHAKLQRASDFKFRLDASAVIEGLPVGANFDASKGVSMDIRELVYIDLLMRDDVGNDDKYKPFYRKIIELVQGKTFNKKDIKGIGSTLYVVTKVCNSSDANLKFSTGGEYRLSTPSNSVGASYSTSVEYRNKGSVVTLAFQGIKFDIKNDVLTHGRLVMRGTKQVNEAEDLKAIIDDMEQAPQFRRRALVFGAGNYKHFHHLQGALCDAEKVAEFLYKAGFDKTSVLDPNYLTMIKNLERFAEGTFSGDLCVLFYAGHGSRRSEAKSSDDSSRFSEVLVPVDSGHHGKLPNRGISDLMLRSWCKLLKQKGASSVAIIIDSCCAGGMSRGDSSTDKPDCMKSRLLAGDARPKGDADGSQKRPPWPKFLERHGLNESAALQENSFAGSEGIEGCVFMTACYDSQQALELPDGGLFTSALLKCARCAGSNSLTYAAMSEQISKELAHKLAKEVSESLKGKCKQDPLVLGERDLLFLQPLKQTPRGFVAGVENPLDHGSRTLMLRGIGSALGIQLGARFLVFGGDTSTNVVGEAEVNFLSPTKTVLLCGNATTLPDVVRVVEHQRPNPRTKIQVDPRLKEVLRVFSAPDDYRDNVSAENRRVVNCFELVDRTVPADLEVASVADNKMVLREGGKCVSEAVSTDSNGSAILMLEMAVVRVHYRHVVALHNPESKLRVDAYVKAGEGSVEEIFVNGNNEFAVSWRANLKICIRGKSDTPLTAGVVATSSASDVSAWGEWTEDIIRDENGRFDVQVGRDIPSSVIHSYMRKVEGFGASDAVDVFKVFVSNSPDPLDMTYLNQKGLAAVKPRRRGDKEQIAGRWPESLDPDFTNDDDEDEVVPDWQALSVLVRLIDVPNDWRTNMHAFRNV